ncbi:M23 family peptidase [Chryseotalea sanaruensis]|uniref:M23 family peptidase n=1 Tax=Chryseotalea sanaruensis TaxID=2482724 RepID=A0A401U514_9BACT|nr:M23 family peptidase [Chryseotalea sanaruensis]
MIAQTDRYLFPIQPGQTASLAGTLGELRSNHFHTGIDIRTNNQVGLAVLATQSGYISRAAMSAGGYGNVLYVRHPDGNTSVYAHLDSFSGGVGQYVLQEQYRRKTFDIDLYFRQNQFPVKKGDTIALSGNTGSSSGPHLHFDIRDKNNLALDPLSFNFPEVIDNAAPYTEKLALKTLNTQSRINDRFGRTEFYVQRNGNDFFLPYPILAYGDIGIELLAKDKLATGSPYFGGVNFVEVYENEKLIFKQVIEKLDLTEGRTINALLSFRTLRGNNNKFYKLYVDDGNTLPFYPVAANKGVIKIKSGEEKSIKIIYKDIFSNSATLNFKLKGSQPEQLILLDNSVKGNFKSEIQDNTLSLSINEALAKDVKAVTFSKGIVDTISLAYGGKFSSTYLIDLTKKLPDSINLGNEKLITHFKAMVPSTTAYTYYGDYAEIFFPKGSIYDTLFLKAREGRLQDSTQFIEVGDPLIPLHRYISIAWKHDMSKSWTKNWSVYRRTGSELSFAGGSVVNDRIKFNTREFGIYQLAQDTIPPSIKPIVVNRSNVSFKIKDDLSGIERYEANINGKWLLMHFDGKSGTIKSERLNKEELLKGDLVIVVSDRAGNIATYKQLIP